MTEDDQMMTAVLNCRRVDLYADRPELNEDQRRHLDRMKARRGQGEPLQYILGTAAFMGLEFAVDPRVLIPRPETELLCEAALDVLRSVSGQVKEICDLGTGSGNIAVSLAVQDTAVRVTAVDISADALDLARANAEHHQAAGRIGFVHGDMVEFLNTACRSGQMFAMIISNPPYVPTGDLPNLPPDVRREPAVALDGGTDGTDYLRAIISASENALIPGGRLLMEIGDGQAAALSDYWHSRPGWTHIHFINDYTGTARIASGERHPH